MTCCNHDCDQGKTCPVRAARNSGVCCTEPDTNDSDLTLYIICMTAVYGICGGVILGAFRYFMEAT